MTSQHHILRPMSRPKPPQAASASRAINIPGSRSRSYQNISELAETSRRASVPIHSSPTMPSVAVPKLSRTSKTSQRHVVLPSEPQTHPLPQEVLEGVIPTYDVRSEGERMSKEDRQRAGYNRMTAYSVAEGIKMRHLSAFLKREHAVLPRVFDEAIYVVRNGFNVCCHSSHAAHQVYHLPLLRGYAPNVNVRSSVPVHGKSILSFMSEAEEYGYEGTYFPEAEEAARFSQDGYISSSPTLQRRPNQNPQPQQKENTDDKIAEAVFFSYGVAVFFGLEETQERDILDDLESANAWLRKRDESDWEVEECHFAVSFHHLHSNTHSPLFQHDPTVAYPRIYNDFFSKVSGLLDDIHSFVDHFSSQNTVTPTESIRRSCACPVNIISSL